MCRKIDFWGRGQNPEHPPGGVVKRYVWGALLHQTGATIKDTTDNKEETGYKDTRIQDTRMQGYKDTRTQDEKNASQPGGPLKGAGGFFIFFVKHCLQYGVLSVK